jgi:hypothetical protein
MYQLSSIKVYIGIYLEGLRKTTKILNQDTRSPVRRLRPGRPKYEAEMLTTQTKISVTSTNAVKKFHSSYTLIVRHI